MSGRATLRTRSATIPVVQTIFLWLEDSAATVDVVAFRLVTSAPSQPANNEPIRRRSATGTFGEKSRVIVLGRDTMSVSRVLPCETGRESSNDSLNHFSDILIVQISLFGKTRQKASPM